MPPPHLFYATNEKRIPYAASQRAGGGHLLKNAGLAILISLLALFFVLAGRHRLLTAAEGAPPIVTEVNIAGRNVAMWKPDGDVPLRGYPVVLFSHGFTGCGKQSIFLTAALAAAGYLVLAPDHHDAACGHGPGHEVTIFERLSTTPSEKPFRKPEEWTEATYRDRRDDLEDVLDAILKARSFQGVPIDPKRIGLAGHSLGGYTVLAMAGAWPSWKDRRVKAVLALSPYCAPLLTKGDLGHLDVPVMYQGGTLDLGITPSVSRPGGAYDLTSAPKYFVELKGASHFAWTNLNKRNHALIEDYAIAFFHRYLNGAGPPDLLAHLVEKPWPASVNDLRVAVK